MSDNIWTPTPERERINFSECEVLIEEQTSSKGNQYHKITFNLFPLAGGDLITDTYFKFQNHSKPWDSDVLPAIRELVTAGKIKNAPDINGKYLAWTFRSWRSYRKNDVQYWRDRAETERQNGQEDEAQKSAGRIQIDERGNEFVEKRYIHILDVFNTQEEAQKASDDHYGVEGQASGVWDEAKEEKGDPPNGPGSVDKATALQFVTGMIKGAMGDNHKVDRDKVETFINDNSAIKAHFTIDSEEVQDVIADAESDPPF